MVKISPVFMLAAAALSLFSLPALADWLLVESTAALVTAPDPAPLVYIGAALIIGAAAPRLLRAGR